MRALLVVLAVLLASPNANAYTAAEYIAIFAKRAPSWYAKDPPRFARIAIAAERAELKLAPKFRKRAMLGPILATLALKESGLWPDTHEGTRRGGAGEICLTQIHPTNPNWKAWAPSFQSLAGTDLLATERCFLAGGQTAMTSLNYCWKRRYFTNWAQAMFTMYHYGNRCWLSPAAHPRARHMRALAASKWMATPEQLKLLADALAANTVREPVEPEAPDE